MRRLIPLLVAAMALLLITGSWRSREGRTAQTVPPSVAAFESMPAMVASSNPSAPIPASSAGLDEVHPAASLDFASVPGGMLAELCNRYPAATARLECRPSEGTFHAKPSNEYSAGLVTTLDGASVRQRLEGSYPVAVAKEGEASVYRQVWPGIDAVIVPQETRVEEFLHIAPWAASALTYELRLESTEHAFQSGTGIEVVDESGTSIFQSIPIVYWTADGREVEPKVEIDQLGDSLARMTITIPVEDRGCEILLDPGWSATGSLLIARTRHSYCTLTDGRVLISGGYVGGSGGHNGSTLCETYNPATGTWSSTGSTKTRREAHTLTVLGNGKVLAAGGFYWQQSGDTVLKTCELYNPVTGTWSSTGTMTTSRRNHTATLLSNGKVLIVGGYQPNGKSAVTFLASCNLYNPATGTCTATGSLAQGRAWHFAVALSNGKVLVGGGGNSSVSFNSCELYDPASGTWTTTGAMSVPGGRAVALSDGTALAVSNNAYNGGFTSEVYNPATGTWSAPAAIPSGSAGPLAVLADGRVLSVGYVYPFVSSPCSLYDPATGTWTATNPLPQARWGNSVSLLGNGQVLSAGGQYMSYAVANCTLYTP